MQSKMTFLYLSLHWTANFHLSMDLLAFLDKITSVKLWVSFILWVSKKVQVSSLEDTNFVISMKVEKSWLLSIALRRKVSSSRDVGRFLNTASQVFDSHFMMKISLSVETREPEYTRCPTDLLLLWGVAHSRNAASSAKEGFPLWWM